MKNNGEKEAEEDGVGGRGGDGKATEGNSFREKRQRREGETRKLKKWTKGGGGGGMRREVEEPRKRSTRANSHRRKVYWI